MTDSPAPHKKPTHDVFEQPLGDGLRYLRALVLRYPGTIRFETGAGHIINDLLARLPSVPQLEDQKTALCRRIVEMVYPLAACLFAESVSMTVTATADLLLPPRVVGGLCTYTTFDLERNVMRHYFMGPPHDDSYIEAFTISSGLAVLCEPLNYDSRHFHENRAPPHYATGTVLQWTERMIGEWYAQRAGVTFVPGQLRLQTTAFTAAHLAGIVDQATLARIQSQLLSPSDIIHPPEPSPSRTMSAFAHEAGFAETAVNPEARSPRLNRPAPKQEVKTEPPKPGLDEAGPHSPHAPHHLPHNDPEMN